MANRVHEMRLAETHAAVQEQRVVRARGRFRNGAAGGMRELIRRPHDECFERVPRTETADAALTSRAFINAARIRLRPGHAWISARTRRNLGAFGNERK